MLFLFLKKSTFPKFPFNFPIFCPAYNNNNNKGKLSWQEKVTGKNRELYFVFPIWLGSQQQDSRYDEKCFYLPGSEGRTGKITLGSWNSLIYL